MKENFITYVDGNFTGPIGKEFYVHSGGFKSVWMSKIGSARSQSEHVYSLMGMGCSQGLIRPMKEICSYSAKGEAPMIL